MELLNINELQKKRISSTALKRAKTSTRDLLYYYVEEKERKGFFDFGNAIELYLIDKSEFYDEVVIYDEQEFIDEVLKDNPDSKKPTATKIFKELKEQFYSENENKYIIPKSGQDSMETILALSRLVDIHPFKPQLRGEYQKAFEWECSRTGLLRYARPDLFRDDVIIDIKTDAQGDFMRSAGNNDHFLQAFDHIVGAQESGLMETVNHYYWFVLTKKAPYYVDVFELDLEKLLRVEESYFSTLLRLKDDIDSGKNIVWHKLPITKVSPPNWYK